MPGARMDLRTWPWCPAAPTSAKRNRGLS